MINAINGKYRKHVAWLLFLLFYGELAASLYAGTNYSSRISRSNTRHYSFKKKLAPSYYPFLEQPAATTLAEKPVKEIQESDADEQTFIDGPGQPEMSSFRSVGADNMVNLFTGDFSYSIPLLDVGGYPVNLFYNAGISMDQEASWVGLGWNLNPGTVSRNMRGLPDDYNEVDSVTNTQSMKPDFTIGVSGSRNKEVFGMAALGSSIKAGIFYNNRRGIGLEAGLSGELSVHKSLSFKNKDEMTFKDTTVASFSLEAGIDLNSQNGMGLSGGFSVYNFDKKKFSQVGLSTSVGYNSRQGLTDLKIGGEFTKYKNASKNQDTRLSGGNPLRLSTSLSFARSSFVPSIRIPITRVNQMYSLKFGREQTGLFVNTVLSGYVNESRIAENDRVQRKPAYGYMYYQEGKDNKNGLLDFNRVNDGVYTYKRPAISLPVYTYDVFTINGEGTGGSFRGYRGNMGNVRDNETQDKTSSLNISLDLGVGKLFHGGVTLGGIYSPSKVEEWKTGNALRKAVSFKKTDGIFQGFYFKNPGEKAIIDENYYNSLGGDQLIRPYLLGTSSPTPVLDMGFQVFDKDRKVERVLKVNSNTYRAQRDKRAQVITYLTALEATDVGLDQDIYSFRENVFKPGDCAVDNDIKSRIPRYIRTDPTFYRKAHHISEVDVLETDGRRYVYGIPVYQVKQKEATFSTVGATANQLVDYEVGVENSVKNKSGRDGSFQSEELGGYAHSFLLTGILSPDYMDVTGNGITDDDLGSAVKFNYSRVYKQSGVSGNYWAPFKWRMPLEQNKANFNEGLKTDNKDNKGLYTYGEKELWYLHSIESKNMVATFRTSARDDGKQSIGENGGASTADSALRKLDRIDLYTKAEFLAKGINAKPVKTVHFAYSYKLCVNYPMNTNGITNNNGKLTLDSIWFSYNGNQRQKRNKYQFKYGSGQINPAYNSSETDRWGSYKRYTDNPKDVSNADYPYTNQQYSSSSKYAAAWNLEKILMPGGATMEISYQADDYAFVQDKRASQMTKIHGFGRAANGPITSTLYSASTSEEYRDATKSDHRFVFFDAGAEILGGRDEVKSKYLQDIKQLLMRIWVEMPRGNLGNSPAYEPVTIYGTIRDYGVVESNHQLFYVELAPTTRGGSPIMETVLQFLKDQLPQRAYPGYEVDGNGLTQLVSAVWGLFASLVQGVMGFEETLKAGGSCKKVDPDLAFARLNSPDLKKVGGGHRVQSIIISDNWSKMTQKGSSGLPDSYYGQVYEYTTTEVVNGKVVTASSGVASYEPGIGNEENPFREVLSYSEKQFLGPTDHSNVELPIAENFFPSPMVGYSKVTVKSIHNKTDKRLKSGIGIQETEFFTTRDFPVIADFTSFDPQSRKHHKPPFLNQVLNFDKKDYVTLTQGFRVILNDMNGKIKSQTSYPENDYKTIINSTRYFYRKVEVGNNKFKLDNILPVISGPDGVVTNKLIGKEVEVMNDFREHFSYTYAKQIPLNLDVFTVGPFPAFFPSLFRMAFHDESMFRSATTLKVVNEFGILDSVSNNDKGSIVGTKNLVYDAETGDVLLSRTNNEFKKPVYQFNYPAWWAESGMQPAYRNIDLTYQNVLFRNGRIEESPHVNMAYFESGDEIYVTNNNIQADESIGCVLGGYPEKLPLGTEKRIWALSTTKDDRNAAPGEFIFIDRNGNPYSAANASIRVIRSGKRNLTGTSIGTIVSLQNPLRVVDNTLKAVFDNSTDVVNASAMKFREKWRATQMFYTKDSTIMTVRQSPILNLRLNTMQSYSAKARRLYDGNRTQLLNYWSTSNNVLEIEKMRRYERVSLDPGCISLACLNREKFIYDQNSWVRFNLADYTTQLNGATIHNASLRLIGHDFDHPTSEIPIGYHDLRRPHRNSYSPGHSFPMTMKISRMISPWFTTDEQWKTKFLDNANDDRINDYVTYTPSYVPGNTDFTGSYTVDITRIAKSMLAHINDNVATGIKLSFLTPGDHINWEEGKNDTRSWRYCFNLFDKQHYEDAYSGSYMEIAYSKCTSSDPIVYQGHPDSAPVTPPAGSVYCSSMETVKMCLSVFDKKQMNPYVEGVLGNWRALRSYVFYGERRESDPAVATDIRTNGVIKDFVPYWVMNTERLDTTTSSKWVWNSVITQYNRKGAELENQDALGRFNSGIYGYQETLPIAVVNNSRLRLAAYDGFEDYSYEDNPCGPYCNPYHRHFNTGISKTLLVDTVAHTGKYSVRIPASTIQVVPMKVSADDPESIPDVRVKMLKTPHDLVTVTPNGRGLTGRYYNQPFVTDGPTYVQRVDPYVNLSFMGNKKGNDCAPYGNGNLPDGVRCNYMSVIWKGNLQVKTTGTYKFMADGDDQMKMFIDHDKNPGTPMVTLFDKTINTVNTQNSVVLTLGELYPVEVQLFQVTWTGGINLMWKQPDKNGVLDDSKPYTSIPPQHFYPVGEESSADGTVGTQTFYCEKPDTIQTIKHQLIDSFNLVAGKKMVASVWVKKGDVPCQCPSYTGVSISVKQENGTPVASFAPKERVIEGWQQFEAIFDVPATPGNLKIEFNVAAGSPLYVDDLRLHPFNANMKSFVYDPVTLRLAAELDENNFATFYEYDDEGIPARVKKETRQGIKTISETRSSLQKNNIVL